MGYSANTRQANNRTRSAGPAYSRLIRYTIWVKNWIYFYPFLISAFLGEDKFICVRCFEIIGEYSAAACTRSGAFLEQVITTRKYPVPALIWVETVKVTSCNNCNSSSICQVLNLTWDDSAHQKCSTKGCTASTNACLAQWDLPLIKHWTEAKITIEGLRYFGVAQCAWRELMLYDRLSSHLSNCIADNVDTTGGSLCVTVASLLRWLDQF